MTAGTPSKAGSAGPYDWRPLTEFDAQAFIALNDAICDTDGSDERADEDGFRFLLNFPLHVPGHEGFQGVFDGERMVAFAWVQRRNGAEPAHWMRAGGACMPATAAVGSAPSCSNGRRAWRCRSTNTASLGSRWN